METVCRFDGEPWGQVAGSALQMARSGSDKWHGQIVTFGRVACAQDGCMLAKLYMPSSW